MNLLITGITGFIGQNLVDFFYLQSYQIFGTSRDPESAGKLLSPRKIQVVKDVDHKYLDENKIDIIIHLAGLAHDMKGNQYSEQDYFEVNYQKTKELYDEFLKSETKTFFYFSSIKAAVDHFKVEIDETVNPSPVTPYGQSKLKAEEYILSHQSTNKKNYILRPCMVYGPNNKGNLNTLYRFVKRGIPYPLGAFNNKRSFLYVKNLEFVIQRMLDHHVEAGIYHVADSDYLSTNELIKIIGANLDKEIRMWNVPSSMIKLAAKLGDLLGIFFNSHTLNKLTENMQVSNRKLLQAIGEPLPYSTEDGLSETIKTFE